MASLPARVGLPSLTASKFISFNLHKFEYLAGTPILLEANHPRVVKYAFRHFNVTCEFVRIHDAITNSTEYPASSVPHR